MKTLIKVALGIIGVGALAALYILLKRRIIEFTDEWTLVLLVVGSCSLLWAFWDRLTPNSSLQQPGRSSSPTK